MTIRLLPTDELLPALQRDYGALYFPLEVPAGGYRGDRHRRLPSSAWRTCWSSTRRCRSRSPTTSPGCCSRSSRSWSAIHPEARHLSPDRVGGSTRRRSIPAPSGSTANKACGSRRRSSAGAQPRCGRRAGSGPAGVAALLSAARSSALRALLGPLHRPAADLSRQLPAGRAGPDVPAVPGATPAADAGRVPALDWLLIAARRRRVRLAAGRFPPVRLPRRRADRDRCGARARSPSCWCSRRRADRRMDPAGHRGRVPPLRLARAVLRRPRPRLLAHRGYGIDAAGRHALHDARGHLRRAARRRRDLHRAVHDLRRGARASGAGAFFIDWALAASGRSAAAPGRSVTVAGFLLGTVSGSGVATTVMLGSVAWPLLRARRTTGRDAPAPCCRRRASALCCRRRRSARRRFSSPSSCRSPISRCW